jgi:hypothetical protein
MTYFNLQNARRNTAGMNVTFIHQNILTGPIQATGMFDLVLSVDTCQTYQDFSTFLKHVHGIMHKDSILAYSDFAFDEDIQAFRNILQENNMNVIYWEDLTDAMCRSIATDKPEEKILPMWQRMLLGKKLQRYLVWSSSEIDSLLNTGELRYIKFLAKSNRY